MLEQKLIQAPLTYIGRWVPSPNLDISLAHTYHAVADLDSSGTPDIAISGWAFSGWPPTLDIPATVDAFILSKVEDSYKVATQKFIPENKTYGAGSIIVEDFNNDGVEDIVMLAHNESPFVPMPSTAFMSTVGENLERIEIDEPIMAHDASLVYVGGNPTILTRTFLDENGEGADHAIFTYQNDSFVASEPSLMNSVADGQSINLITTTSGRYQVVIGDVATFDGGTVQTHNINIYGFDGKDITSPQIIQSIEPYLSTLDEFSSFPSSIGGAGLTHTYRLGIDDLNQDGLDDILAFQSMWTSDGDDYPSALQILIAADNNSTYIDRTSELNPEMSLDVTELAYSPQYVDLDGSGINAYLLSGSSSPGPNTKRISDHILLNDGTGRLYVAIHEEFEQVTPRIIDYLGLNPDTYIENPKFIQIPNSDGSIDIVAEVLSGFYDTELESFISAYEYVQVGASYNPTQDFTRDIVVSDRNGSSNIRTWAGNDYISDKNRIDSSEALINGGLGIDVSAYDSESNRYNLVVSEDSIVVYNDSVRDTLTNIERIEFSDKSIAMDIDGNTGRTVKTIAAVLGSESISDAGIVGVGLSLFDQGYSLETVCGLALNYVGATTDEQVVDLLYANLLGDGEAPTAEEAQPYLDLLEREVFSHESLAAAAAELTDDLGIINLAGLAATGIEYI